MQVVSLKQNKTKARGVYQSSTTLSEEAFSAFSLFMNDGPHKLLRSYSALTCPNYHLVKFPSNEYIRET